MTDGAGDPGRAPGRSLEEIRAAKAARLRVEGEVPEMDPGPWTGTGNGAAPATAAAG